MIDIVTGELTILILQKYGFRVCVISFGFYSTHFKVYIHLTSIKKQRRTTAPFDNTPVIPSSDRRTTVLYQGSADCYEGDIDSDIIILIQPYQTIHYCNQSVLAIVPDVNIFVFSITIFDLISRSALVRIILLRASYLYKLTGLRFYIFCSLPESCLRYCHCHGWVHCIFCSCTALRFCYRHRNVWVWFIHTKKSTVACMSLLLLSIYLRQICYFNFFPFNWPMVQRSFSHSRILNLFICFIFEYNCFADN